MNCTGERRIGDLLPCELSGQIAGFTLRSGQRDVPDGDWGHQTTARAGTAERQPNWGSRVVKAAVCLVCRHLD